MAGGCKKNGRLVSRRIGPQFHRNLDEGKKDVQISGSGNVDEGMYLRDG